MSASKAFAFSLALLLGAGTQVAAQSTVVYDEAIDSGSDSSGSISGATPIGNAGGYFWVQGDFGERPGIPGNYASFGSFAPIGFMDPSQQFFIDGQVMVNDDTELGTSVGLGYRKLVDPWGSIFGINSFYTFDQSRNNYSYNQGGVGGEWLTDFFQLSANAYIPFDSGANKVGSEIRTKNSIFLNDNLAFINIQNAEAQLRGADFEVAVPVPGAQWLSVGGGGYVYDAKYAESYKGFRGRLQADMTNVLLNLSLAKDDVYGSQVNFAATYLFGAQNGNYSLRTKSLYDRMNDRVRRTSRIATQGVTINPLELAINPRTGLAWTFSHFDNTAAAGGDGSFEARYNALVASTPADAILIHRGTTDRTTLLAGGTGIALNDNQLVFGEGCPTFIDVANRPGAPCPLPATWATTGTNPFVTADPGSNVFTLADNNRIAGLNIIAPLGGNAIVGTGIEDFRIEKLNRNIDPTLPVPNGTTGQGGGVLLTNASGTGVIDDVGFNIPSVTGPSGIVINNTNTDPLNVSITNGRFINGGQYGVAIRGNNSSISATIDNVNNDSSGTGLQLQATNTGVVTANVTDSHFDNAQGGLPNTGDGIEVTGSNGEINLTVQNTTASGAARDGLHTVLSAGSDGEIVLRNVDLSDAGDDAIYTALGSSTLTLDARDVDGTGAADDGFDFRLTAGSVLNASLVDSDLSDALDDGIVGSLTGGSQATLFVSGTEIEDVLGDGLNITSTGASRFTGTLTNSSLDGAGGNGAVLSTSGGSIDRLTLDNSDATNAGANGLVANVSGAASRADIILQNQSFDSAGLDALHLESSAGGILVVAGNNVSGANADDDGIDVRANNSQVTLNLLNAGSFANAGDDGIHFEGNNNALVQIGIDGAPSSFNGAGRLAAVGQGDGIDGRLNNSDAELVLTDVTFQQANGEGLGITAIAGSTFTGEITNGSFNNAGSNGVRLTLNDSDGDLSLDNTDVFSAGGDAIHVTAVNNSSSIVELGGLIGDIILSDAADDAIDLNATDSEIQLLGTRVLGANAGDDAIHMAAVRSQIGLQLLNTGSFADAQTGDGIDFSGLDNSTLNVLIQGGAGPATFDRAAQHGILGDLQGSSEATLNLTNTSFADAGLEGMLVNAIGASTFNGNIVGSDFSRSGAGRDAVQMNLDNSIGNLTLNGVLANDAGGRGLTITAAANSSSTNALLNGTTFNDAADDAIHVESNTGSNVLVSGLGVTGARAGDDGIDLNVQTGSIGRILLNNAGSFEDAVGDGIVLRSVGLNSLARVDVTGPLASFDGAGDDGVDVTVLAGARGELNLNGVTAQDVQDNGIIANVSGAGSTLVGTLNTVALDRATTGDAIQLATSAGGLISITGSEVSGSEAGRDGIHLAAITGSRIDLNLTDLDSFSDAGQDGIDFAATGGSLINLTLDGAPGSFDRAAGNGIIGALDGSTANVNLSDLTFRDAGVDGLHLDLQNLSTLTGNITGADFSRQGPAPTGDDGVEILLDNSNANLTLTSAINNAGDDAIHLEAVAGSNLNLKVNGGPLLNAGGDMTDITAAGGSLIVYNLDPLATGANQNGLRFNVTTNSRLDATITNSPMSTPGAANVVGQNGVLGNLDTNGIVNLLLEDSDITNATLDAVNVNARGGSTFNAMFRRSDLSNAGQDGLDLTLDNATGIVRFENSNIADVGGDAIRIDGNAATLGLGLDGVSLANAGGNGIIANLRNSSLAQFTANNFLVQGAGLDGVHLELDNSRIVNSTFTNGQIDSNGVQGVAGSRDGLQIIASNGSNIGTRATNSPGLIFNNVSFQNDLTNPRPQEHGLNVNVEGDSFVGMDITGAQIRNNDGDGILANVNGAANPGDSSLLVMTLRDSNVDNNWGDGLHVTATNGIDDVTPPQLSGAIFNILGSTINNNGNFINNPPTGVIGDGIGDGIDARAIGDNSVAGNTQITFNLNNSDVLGNEEAGLTSTQSGGGSVNFNLVGGAVDDLEVPCADGPLAFVSFTLNGTVISNTEALTLCAKNGGVLQANVANVDFDDNTGPGILILSETGGSITADLSDISVQRNGVNVAGIPASVNPPINTVTGAIQGVVDGAGSTLDLTMNNMTVTDNAAAGLDLTVSNGAQLDALISNSDFSDNGSSGAFDGIIIDTSGAGSDANVQLTNVLANNATDDGIDLLATGGANFDIGMDNVSANGAAADGLSLLLDAGTGRLDVNGLSVNDADGRAVNIIANNASTLDVSALNSVSGLRAGQEGLNLDVLAGSNLTDFTSNGLNLADSGRLNPAANGVDVLVDTGSTTSSLILFNVNADNAQGDGLNVVSTSAATQFGGLTVNGVSFQNAGGNGIDVSVADQTNPMNVVFRGVNASNAGNYGVLLNVNNVTGGESDIVLDNVIANGAQGNDGLEVNITGLTATDSAQLIVRNNSSFNDAAGQGMDINLNGAAGSTVVVDVDGVTANNAAADAVHFDATGGMKLRTRTFNNVTATGAGGTGLLVTTDAASSLSEFLSNTVNVSGAAGDGVSINVDAQTIPTAIAFNGLNASNAGQTGVDIVLDGVNGASSVSLTNVNATGAQNGEGVNLDVINMAATDSVTLTLDTVDVSGASEDGLNMQLDGAVGSTATVNLDGLTATGNRRDGIDLSLSSGVAATVNQFDGVISTGNGENGLQIDVATGAQLTAFTADGINLSNNGASGLGFDGLDVQVRDAGSSAVFNLSNLTVNNSGGRGIDLDVYDNGALTFNLDTATVDRSGLGGIDINVGSLDEFGSPIVSGVPATFNSNLTDVIVTNSGQSLVFTADGVNIDVDGAGTVSNMVLDHVVSSNNDQDGFDIRVDNGANGTFGVNNATTGNANRGTGFKFAADGAATVVSLTSASGALGDNTFNNNTGDPTTLLDGPGVSVRLTNAVTATNLVIGASATGNDGDGLQILANDGSGVTINNFGISGNALQVNNNAGNGLLVDFFNVNGVNAFDLANMTVSGNQLDQIHAQFRQMSMDHISLDNVTTTGVPGSGDGVEINLLDTQLTRIAANGYAFSATNMVSTNNGGFGLNLIVDETGVPNAIQTSGIPNGLIRQSEFASNGAAGVRMSFGGDSHSDFDIINNTDGFHDNAQEGILIEVQDAATYRMTGTNLVLAGAQSMYDNQIVNNGGIGFRVVASEPLDTNVVVPDGIGPRIELSLGDILRNPNTITGNVDAAMAVEMSGDATGTFSMVNSILTQTTDGANANFNGDGLAFLMTDFSSLESLTIDGAAAGLDISDNAGSGLVTNVQRFAELGTTSRLTVLNTTIQRNGLHGIDIQRSDDALYGPDTANNAIIIGSAGNGNLLRDNTQNGLNIVLGNTPGGILPFQIDVTDNTFERNLNGVFLNGTGNSQFIGNISDNDFDGQRQDGIQVRLENDAAIGDPRLANNPTLTPFMFEGNQILNSVRDGIRFDTNFTNEGGNFGAGAYANVLITESANFVDGFGNPVRTLIDGNGAHGVHIIDNSDFFAAAGTAVTQQNTYRIINSDITGNIVDGVHVNVGANTGIRDANNGIALIIGDPANADQRDVQINFNGDDGVDLELAGADSITNNVRISHTTINNNGANGDATGGNGIETDVMNFGVTVAGTTHFGQGSLDMLLETLDVQNNVDDGIRFDVTSTRQNQAKTLEGTALATNAVTLVEMFGVDASQNGGRGLYANLQHDRLPVNQFDGLGFAGTASTSVFNIGRGDRFNDATAVNRFNGNDREGVVFDQQATGLDQDTTNKPSGWPHVAGLVDVNDDVWVETDLPQFYTQNPAWSTNHAIAGLNPGSLQETRVHLNTTVNFIQNEVANNGTNFEDGIAFGIGATTRLNAQIAGNSFGGNVGDDMRFYPQRSNDLNAPNSFQDTANDGPHTHLVYDPVAYLDVILGAVDTNLNGTVDTVRGNGLSADANGAASNGVGAGEQISVLTFGTNQTAQITNDGVFTNNDPVKGGNRPVLLVGQIQVNGVWDSEVINSFIENGVQQTIDTEFFFFDQNGVTNFPDAVFP